MARDAGLEEWLRELLDEDAVLDERPMFGGLAWLLDGNLVCAARDDGVLIRLGKGKDGWALAMAGIESMTTRGRAMTGWVWVKPETFANEKLARRLLDAALTFVRALPPK
jgi:hypothetical protein